MLAALSLYKLQQENAIKQRDDLLEKLETKYIEYIQSLLKQKLLIANNINKKCDEIIYNANNCIYNCINNTITINANQLSNNIPTSNPYPLNTTIKSESKDLFVQHLLPANSYSDDDKCSIGSDKYSTEHTCNKCNKTFKHKSNLKIHYIIHTDQALPCPHCDRKFARKTNLTQHLRVHTGEKPYICTICNKSFTQSHSLKNHIGTHKEYKVCKTKVSKSDIKNANLSISNAESSRNSKSEKRLGNTKIISIQPARKRKSTSTSMKQTQHIKGFEYFSFCHKKDAICLSFQQAYRVSPQAKKLTYQQSKRKMFRMDKIIHQMVICFSYIRYLPKELNAENIISEYNDFTLNVIGLNKLNKFIESYNEKIKLMPKDICFENGNKPTKWSNEQMLKYLDQMFDLEEVSCNKMEILKHMLYRGDFRGYTTNNNKDIKYDWDREWIYKHFIE